MGRLGAFLADRLGAQGWGAALRKPLPHGVGWLHSLGSVALFLILLQAGTGIVMAMHYVPSPAEAHDSVAYFIGEVLGGQFVRSVHYWSANALIIVLVLHLLRVFLHGAYKPPRELTWMAGVLLFTLVLGFAFTGDLLRWDQKGYWMTVIGVHVAGSTPLIGKYLQTLLMGDHIGALTLPRFYALHILVLPAAAFALMGLHVFLVWRKGPAPPGRAVGESGTPASTFHPYQLLRDSTMMIAAFGIVAALAIWRAAPLEAVADPTSTAYTPRPPWFLDSIFFMLQYAHGFWQPFVSVILPGLFIGFLLLLPFLDRNPERRLRKRPVAALAAPVIVIVVAGMTYLGSQVKHAGAVDVAPATATLTTDEQRGQRLIKQLECLQCHALGGVGGSAGPDLARAKPMHDPQWQLEHFKNPGAALGGTQVAAHEVWQADGDAIRAYLARLSGGAAAVSISAAEQAKALMRANGCVNCHTMNGGPSPVGPDLQAVGLRRTLAYIKGHIRNAKKDTHDTQMPPFPLLTDQQIDTVANYLMSLRTQAVKP